MSRSTTSVSPFNEKKDVLEKDTALEQYEKYMDENDNILVGHAPILLLLKVCGLISGKFIHPNYRQAHVTYSLVLVIVGWIEAVRFVFLFDFFSGKFVFNASLLLKAVMVCYAIISATMRTALFYITSTSRLADLYADMSQLKAVVPGLCYVQCVRKKAAVTTAMCTMLIVLTMIFWIYEALVGLGMVFHTTPFQKMIPVDPHDIRYIAITAFSFPVYLSLSTSWHLTSAFFIALTISLKGCFDGTLRALENELEEAASAGDNEAFVETVYKWRFIHQKIRKSTELLDNTMLMIVAPNLAFCILAICILLYSFITGTAITTITTALQTTSWLLLCAMYLFLFNLFSAQLNESAHAHIHILHELKIRGKNYSEELAFQMNTFISQLAHDDIGISVFTMFVLKRETILAITTAIITYFILLLDYGSSPPAPKCFCNFTNPANLTGT